jgi:hypothetical protein
MAESIAGPRPSLAPPDSPKLRSVLSFWSGHLTITVKGLDHAKSGVYCLHLAKIRARICM